MKDYAKTLAIGYVAAEPEYKMVKNNQHLTTFPMICNLDYKDGNKMVPSKSHLKVVTWGPLAQLMKQICHKGNKVFVDGAIRVKNFQNKATIELWSADVRILTSDKALNKTDYESS